MLLPTTAHLLSLLTLTSALSIPDLERRQPLAVPDLLPASFSNAISSRSPRPIMPPQPISDLEKRRGGGGGGGRGGGSSGSGSSGSGSSGSSSSGSSSSGSRGGGTGGTTGTTGSSPSFGGGRSYAGGSTSAYSSGGRSPSGISPVFLGAGVGVLGGAALFGAYSSYGYYGYPYSHPYPYYYNNTARQNQSLPVECFCAQYNPCGCDDTNDPNLVQELLKNSSVANVTMVNGTRKVVINGTLANGTDSLTIGGLGRPEAWAGYWVMGAAVAGIVLGL